MFFIIMDVHKGRGSVACGQRERGNLIFLDIINEWPLNHITDKKLTANCKPNSIVIVQSSVCCSINQTSTQCRNLLQDFGFLEMPYPT